MNNPLRSNNEEVSVSGLPHAQQTEAKSTVSGDRLPVPVSTSYQLCNLIKLSNLKCLICRVGVILVSIPHVLWGLNELMHLRERRIVPGTS